MSRRTTYAQRSNNARSLTFTANLCAGILLAIPFVNGVVANDNSNAVPLTPGFVPWSWVEGHQ